MGKDHARTPYSAPEIRAACPEGRVSTYRIESGKTSDDATLQTFRFGKGDEAKTQLTVSMSKRDGTAIGPARSNPMNWRSLQSHASFPEKQTKITEGRAKTPTGEFDCWVYKVTQEAAGVETVRTFHFAKRLPGPPVKMTQTIAGKLAMTMTLVRHRRGDESMLLDSLLPKDIARTIDFVGARQISKFEERFDAKDADRDGKITRAEHEAAFKEAPSIYGFVGFEPIDANHDGVLSKSEWVALRSARFRCAFAFALLARSEKEGEVLTARDFLQSEWFENEAAANAVFARFDRNEDGKLELPEFLRTWIEWSCDP